MNKKLIVMGVFLILLMTIISPVTSISKKTSNTLNLDGNGWVYDEETGIWSIEFPAEPIDESFTTKLYMQFVRRVVVIFSHEYNFPQYSDGDKSYISRGIIEISRDSGESWEVYDVYENSSSESLRDFFMVVGQFFRVRFTVEGVGDSFLSESGGFWRIWDIDLIGDTKGEPPALSVSLSSIFPPYDWYPTILLSIYANDRDGVREIHYIIAGKETVVYDSEARYVMRENRWYNKIIGWAVDNIGNEAEPIIYGGFGIDNQAPIVKIKSPEQGIYFLGKKLPIQINKTIIIGGFNIEADIYDETSGIYNVRFYLKNDIWPYTYITDLTEEPFSIYCGIKHQGDTELIIRAEDWAQNVAQVALDIVYYNFL